MASPAALMPSFEGNCDDEAIATFYSDDGYAKPGKCPCKPGENHSFKYFTGQLACKYCGGKAKTRGGRRRTRHKRTYKGGTRKQCSGLCYGAGQGRGKVHGHVYDDRDICKYCGCQKPNQGGGRRRTHRTRRGASRRNRSNRR